MNQFEKAVRVFSPKAQFACLLLLFAGGVLLSACGKETGNHKQETQEEIAVPQAKATVAQSAEIVHEGAARPQPEEESPSENDTADGKGSFDTYGEQYSLIEVEEGEYEVTLYDTENHVVHRESFLKLPWVSEMTDDILQIGMANGSPATLYIYYFDKERAIVSGCYSDPFYLRDHYGAYMKDEKTLVLTDLFEEKELHREIHRDFSDSMMQYLAIKEMTWITLQGQDVVVLEYFAGEDRELITELIPVWEEDAPTYYQEEDIVKEYEVLRDDICDSVCYDFENVHPTVREDIKYELQNHEEIAQKYGKNLQIAVDYHLFDFNDDGLDDYLVCIDRELYDGRTAHRIKIYITREERGWITKEEMGDVTVRSALWLDLPTSGQREESGHKQITVLREQKEGFHAIVLPETNLILRYQEQAYGGEYRFCDQ